MPNTYQAEWQTSIKFKLLTFGIMMSIIPLMLLGFYYMQVTKKNVEDSIHQQHNLVALRVSNTVSELVNTLQTSLETIALVNADSFIQQNKKEQEHILYSVLNKSPHIEQLTMVSASGFELAKVSKRSAVSDKDLLSLKDSPEFLAIRKGELYVGTVDISPDNQVIVNIAVPVGEKFNHPIGGIVASISLRQVIEELTSINPSNGSYIMLINNTGELIGHSDYSQVLRRQHVLSSVGVQNLTSKLNQSESYDQSFTAENYVSYTGDEVLGVYGVVPNTNWGIVIEQPQAIAYQSLRNMLARLGLAAIITMIGLTSLSIFFSFQFLRPVEALAAGVSRVKQGNLNTDIPVLEQDELGMVIHAFNDMTQEIKKKREQEQIVIQAEKKAAIGQLAAGVAHEINNPMNNLNYYADDLLERIETEDIQDLYNQGVISTYLVIIKEQIERCSSITQNLLNFARETGGKIQTVSLPNVIHDTIKLVQHQIKNQSIIVTLEFQESLPSLQTDPSLLQQMLLNLVTNSIDAMKEGGTLTIHLSFDKQENLYVLNVKDTGYGIPHDIMQHIFDPFYTTKPIGEGTGLGLAISQSIIHRLRGSIHIASEQHIGTEVTVKIPRIKGEDHID